MKLKTSWHFTKQDGLNIVIQYIRCFKNLCGSPNTLLHIPLKTDNKMKKILSPVYSFILKLKNISLFLTWCSIFIFFKWSYSQRCFDVAQRCENLRWKWQRCFDVWCCSNQRWNRQRWFDVVQRCKFQRWRTQRCFNVDLKLCNVATSYNQALQYALFVTKH